MRSYTAYNQRDARWGNIKLGTSNVTISEDGCYITSFCIAASLYGRTITPDQLNQIFITKGLYAGADYVSNDNDLQNVYPDIVYQGTDHYENIPADLSKLQAYMNDEAISVILEIDLGGSNTHFVVSQACDGHVVTIVNPWDGLVENFTQDYGDPIKNILKFVVYRGTVPVVQQPTPQPDQQAIIDDLRTARDNNWNLYQGEVAKNKTLTDQTTLLQSEVNGLSITNEGLTVQIGQVKKNNQDYLDKLSAYEQEDQTAITEGIKAQNQVKQDQQDFKDIAEAAGAEDTTKNTIIGKILDMKATISEQQKTQQRTANQAWLFIQQFFTNLSKNKKT